MPPLAFVITLLSSAGNATVISLLVRESHIVVFVSFIVVVVVDCRRGVSSSSGSRSLSCRSASRAAASVDRRPTSRRAFGRARSACRCVAVAVAGGVVAPNDARPRLVLNKPSSAMSSILLDRQEYLKRDADDARIYVYLA